MFSIRNILVGIFLAFSLVLAGIVAKATQSAYSNYHAQQMVADMAVLDQAFFTALLNFRSERGDSATALTLPIAQASGSIASVGDARKSVDGALNDAFAKGGDISNPAVRSALSSVEAMFAKVKEQRGTVDQALAVELDKRSPGLDKAVLDLGQQFLVVLEDASVAIEGEMRSLSPDMLALIQIRAQAWAARAYGGTATVVLNAPIAANRPLVAGEASKIASADGAALFGWNATKVLVKHPQTPESLKAAVETADKAYFSGEFATMRAQVVSRLDAGQAAGLSIDEWRPTVTKALGTIAAVASGAMSELNIAAATRATNAFHNLVLFSVLLIAVVALGVGGMVVVIRRITQPVSALTSCMSTLAEGRFDIEIPGSGRTDEIGGMARSVEVFRAAGLRNRELEAEATAERQRQEVEREEMRRKAEADAEERLNQAMATLAQALRRLADGDMLCEIVDPLAPQFEQLRSDFNASVAQLREALRTVEQAAGSVGSGSTEISSATSDLAKRTEQQAAALEETAAALEEITVNVTSTSRRAAEARNVVIDARQRADQSGHVVRNAVSAMERIEESSRQIGQIIGVIDEIAFQTNLLALNAGVEAARAGDAGKGFAVVAQEVRELAQRSANAAKEIKGLIGNSAVAVGEGVKLVNDTGSGLAAIEQLVQSINAHMDAIATAAQEQSAGLAEVNTAVNHMDQSTQQNAAMVEEMNAAGVSLAQESTALGELLQQFRLGTAAPAAALRQTAARMREAAPVRAPAPARPAAVARPMARTAAAAAVAPAADSWEEF